VRQIFQRTEPNMPTASTLTEAVDRRIVQDRILAQLSIAFGVVAIVLATIGLYGLLSYGIARRTNEIGIRKALGAQHRMLITMIARETGWGARRARRWRRAVGGGRPLDLQSSLSPVARRSRHPRDSRSHASPRRRDSDVAARPANNSRCALVALRYD
jgi:hypothetical protein